MRSLRLVASLLLAFAFAGCTSGGAAGWTFVPTAAPPSASAAASGAAGSGAPASGAASESGSPSASGGAASGENLALTAQGLKFDKTDLSASANKAFSITLTNQDSGIPHNVTIQSSSGDTVFAGDNITSGSKTYSIKALSAGTYKFFCSVHPTSMTGTLTVK